MSGLQAQLSQLEQVLSESRCSCEAHAVGHQLVEAAAEDRNRDVAARSFDLRRECEPWVQGMPDGRWPTAALAMTVRNGILTPPWNGGLKRSVMITSALGLLGERGLLADAYVRMYLARPLARRLITVFAAVFVHARENGRDPSSYPYQASDWFARFAELDSANAALSEVTSEALSGDLMGFATSWLDRAALAHVIDWRTTDYLEVDVDSRDRVLQGGRDATVWVFDRFSYTSTDEWRRGSAEWELAFARDPSVTAAFVGVPRSVLDERPTSAEMAASAQVRRFLSSEGGDEAARGLLLSDMVEQILAALRRGDIDTAIAEARHAYALAPQDFTTANALGFCLVPIHAEDALHLLKDLKPKNHREGTLRLANCASAWIRTSNWAEARGALGEIVPGEMEAHLWDPTSLATGKAAVKYVTVSDWVEAAEAVVNDGRVR